MSKFRFFVIDHLRGFRTIFFARFLEILTTGSLEIGTFLQKQSVSNFRATTHALHLTGFFRYGKSQNCWVLCIVTFSNIPFKRLKPSTRCVQLRRKIAKIVRALSTNNDRYINGMFVFAILVHVLNYINKSARENCVRPP